MGLPLNESCAAPGGTPQEKKARLFGILLAQMEGLARQRPMLVVLEDAHWLDPTSAELFERVVDRIRVLPILLVATLRPDVPTPWTNFPHVTLLSLNRLGRPASRSLIQMSAGERSLPPIVIEAILSRTEGVPLFVEELTKAVLEIGDLEDNGQPWRSRARRPTSAAGYSGDARGFADGASRPFGSGARGSADRRLYRSGVR